MKIFVSPSPLFREGWRRCLRRWEPSLEARGTSSSELFGDSERNVETLRVIESRVAEGLVGLRQVVILQLRRASRAFSHVLACQLQMHAS